MKPYFIAVLCVAMLSGCASMVSTSTYPVAINSSPSGADFVVTNEDGVQVHTGVTPATVTLRSDNGYLDGETYSVDFYQDGRKQKTELLDSSLDGWYLGNLLFGGIAGLLMIDPATGACRTGSTYRCRDRAMPMLTGREPGVQPTGRRHERQHTARQSRKRWASTTFTHRPFPSACAAPEISSC